MNAGLRKRNTSFEPKCKMHRRYCLRAIKATLVSVTPRTAVTSTNLTNSLKLTTFVQEFRSYHNSEDLTLKSLAYDGFNSIKHKKRTAKKRNLPSKYRQCLPETKTQNLNSVRMKQHQNGRDARHVITCACQETVSSLTNKFVLILTTTGCGQCAIPPR